jgi:methionyl-tRNA formyltransferase
MRLANKLLSSFAVAPNHSLLFFGSGRVALPALKLLHATFRELRVVTQSSHGQSRSFNEVENYCVQHGVKWSSPITSKDDRQKRAEQWGSFIETLDRPTFGVVCSYGFMLPSRLIGHFEQGLIVVHPSLLPKYRGGAPIFHAVANGDSVSGVSYIEISKGVFDSGNILHQVEVPISLTDQYDSIESHLAQEAANHLPFVLNNLDTLRPGKPQKELESQI